MLNAVRSKFDCWSTSASAEADDRSTSASGSDDREIELRVPLNMALAGFMALAWP